MHQPLVRAVVARTNGAAKNLRSWLAKRFCKPTFGEKGERCAVRYLRRHGLRIVATRRRLRYGEIDVVAVDGETIAFIEVKTRRTEIEVRPAEAVDFVRRRRLTRAATAFLKSHGLLDYAARFDIVEVIWPANVRRPTVRHHKNAFSAEGRGQFFR
jgi:putative endonuclease